MLKRHHILIILFSIIITGGAAACKKWAAVDAPLQVNENKILSTEQGFREVLNGVYLKMNDSTLYGRELTFGLASVLGRSYDTTSSPDVISPNIKNVYYQGLSYNFQHGDVKSCFARIWEGMYQGISNLNFLLTNVESRKSVFANQNIYNSIKGEALGLRAFLYFDLVRLFGPAPAVDLNAEAIPYVTESDPRGGAPVYSTGAVIDACITDLLAAEPLLSTSDLTTSRMTVWGVRGLLARIYLYKGDLVNAQKYAMDLINSKQFPLNTVNPSTSGDYMFAKEHLFSLYAWQTQLFSYFKYILSATPALGFGLQGQAALYTTNAGSGTDWRKYFHDPTTASDKGTLIMPRKFSPVTTGFNVLPMIRMSEMYYIAAECATAFKDSLAATNLLDSVRKGRGMQPFGYTSATNIGTGTKLRTDSLAKEIAREYQKEFLAEGQVFYYYKRKNLSISSLPYTRMSPVTGASYVFIKPE